MKVRAILTADNHLDPNAAGFGPNRFRRREDHLRCFEEVVEYAKKERPELLLMGGDLFDSVRPSNATRARVMECFRSLHERGIRVFMVSGHHDTPKSIEEGASPLAVYGNSGLVRFFSNPSEPTGELLSIEGLRVRIVGVSHNPLHEAGDDPLSNLKPNADGDFNILLTHYPIQGFGGWIGDEPVIQRSSLPQGFQLVASGHFHDHQSKDIGSSKVIYLGSTERVDFSEEGEEKGFIWLEFAKDGTISTEFIRTPARPYRTLRLEFPRAGDPLERIKEKVEEALSPEVVLRIRLYGRVSIDELAKYRRPELLSFCQGRVFHCFVEEDELEVLSPQAPEPLPRTTPLEEVRRYFREAMVAARDEEERRVLQEALKLSVERLEGAGAW